MGRSAFGTLLKRGDGGGTEVFTNLGEVTSIQGPGFSMETLDVTNHSSPSAYREVVPSFKSAGDVTVELNFDPGDGQQDATTGVLKDFEDRTLRNWQLVFPTTGGEVASFSAYVTAFQPSAPVDGKLSASMTLSISGPVTWS